MITGITKEMHVFTDYTYIPVVLAAPNIGKFEQDELPANVCRAFAGTVLAYSLLTDAKWGAVKLISYKTHAALDLSSGFAALAVAMLPSISKNKAARNCFLIMGITGLVVGTLSLIGANRRNK